MPPVMAWMNLAQMGRTPAERSEWDLLNAAQAKLYLEGKTRTPEYTAIIKRMGQIAPPGYGWPSKGV